MALIKFQTNVSLPGDAARALTENLIKAVARTTNVPAHAIRVELSPNLRMRMADPDEPIAHIEIREVEFPKDRARELVTAICPILEHSANIKESNVYMAVISKNNSMWRVTANS